MRLPVILIMLASLGIAHGSLSAEAPPATQEAPATEQAQPSNAEASDKEKAKEDDKKSPADQKASPQRFVPSEQVRADFDVSFPIDI